VSTIEALARRGVDLALPPPRQADRPCGVYVLVRDGRAICVGVTSQIETRIALLFHGVPGKRPATRFDRAIWLPLPRADLPAYAGALIRALRPPMNTRVPALCGRDLEVLERLGLPPHDEVAAQAAFRARRAERKARS